MRSTENGQEITYTSKICLYFLLFYLETKIPNLV
jgi:hypothetical protein